MPNVAAATGPCILHVISGLGVGGAEATLVAVVRGLAARGWTSAVVSLRTGGRMGGRLGDTGIPVTSVGLDRAIDAPRAAGALRRLADRHEAALIQGWMYHGNLAALAPRVAARYERPMLWNVRHALHDFARERLTTRLAILAGARLSRMAHRIVYNSATAAEQHARIGYARTRAVVIPNGFDVDRFRPLPGPAVRAELGIPSHAVVIGWVGRFHPIKGLDTFLAAARAVADTTPDLRLVLAGTGMTLDHPVVGDLVRRLGLAGRVHLVGEVDEVPRIMAAMDVFCLASRSESFPNALAEAMLCGVPCVATRVGEVERILGDTGSTVEPEDPMAMANALLALLAESEADRRRRGLAARARIASTFGLDRMIDAYDALYRLVLAP